MLERQLSKGKDEAMNLIRRISQRRGKDRRGSNHSIHSPTEPKRPSYFTQDSTESASSLSPVSDSREGDSTSPQLSELKEEPTDALEPVLTQPQAPDGSAELLVVNEHIPERLIHGLELFKVTSKKKELVTFRINPHTYELSWGSKLTSRFLIETISEIREGEDAKHYRETCNQNSSLSSRWATICFNYIQDARSHPRQLHIVAQSMEDYQLFISTIRPLMLYRQALSTVSGLSGETLLEGWKKNALGQSNVPPEERTMTLLGIEILLERFYIFCPRRFLKGMLKEIRKDDLDVVSFSNFQQLIQLLRSRPEITNLFKTYVDIKLPQTSADAISADAFRKFCIETQKMDASDEEIDCIFEQFSTTEMKEEITAKGIILAQFLQVLTDASHMPIISPPVEDLSRPITEYFISSSHNTYLVGRQVLGQSSIEPYISVLEEGCRCVEIDVWDGDDGPIVNHGRTFSSHVSFHGVIEAINKYAFCESPLPVILSFEIHCDMENQKKMVKIMKDAFQEKLVTESLMTNSFSLPSPVELKNKVLVKVKPGQNKMGGTGSAPMGQPLLSLDMQNGAKGRRDSISDSDDDLLDSVNEEDMDKRFKSMARWNRADADKCKICDELGDLGVYVQGIKFPHDFSKPISKTVNHCFSLSEDTMSEVMKDDMQDAQLVKHNKKFFLRTYPSFRLTSSNYDPIPYWKRGCQMVSLNWQTYGELTFSGVSITVTVFRVLKYTRFGTRAE